MHGMEVSNLVCFTGSNYLTQVSRFSQKKNNLHQLKIKIYETKHNMPQIQIRFNNISCMFMILHVSGKPYTSTQNSSKVHT